MRSLLWIVFLVLLSTSLRCTPPVFTPPVAEEDQINANWSNVGKLNANFIATSRSLGVSTNAGSPTFQISFIASASNIDSLQWSFPGGVTPDTISDVTEIVTYDRFGQFDVGLEVFNTEDSDRRFYENFIEIFFRDDFRFTTDDATSWIVTGTGVSTNDFVPYRNTSGNYAEDWITVPFDVNHQTRAVKQFSSFPKNNLVLEFDYRLERIPVIYIDHNSFAPSTVSSPALATYVAPLSSTASDVRVETPATYPGARRFYIEYNGIPFWVSSNMNDEFFEHIRLDLPSQSEFSLGIVREAQSFNSVTVPYTANADSSHNPSTLNSPYPMEEDLDRDGIPDTTDEDIDGDGYLNTTEWGASTEPAHPDLFVSDPEDEESIPKYVMNYIAYPYILNIRNMTIKVRED